MTRSVDAASGRKHPPCSKEGEATGLGCVQSAVANGLQDGSWALNSGLVFSCCYLFIYYYF